MIRVRLFAILFLAAFVATGFSISPRTGPAFDLTWHTIDGGGGTSTGGGFELAGTIGQHDAGPAMTGGTFELRGGFWLASLPPPPSTADLNGDGCADSKDLTILLGAWCSAVNDPIPPSPPCENCTQANLDSADIAGPGQGPPDGCVDSNDLTKLLGEWCSVGGGNPCGTCGP